MGVSYIKSLYLNATFRLRAFRVERNYASIRTPQREGKRTESERIYKKRHLLN